MTTGLAFSVEVLIVTANNGLPYVEVCTSSIHNHNFSIIFILLALKKQVLIIYHFIRIISTRHNICDYDRPQNFSSVILFFSIGANLFFWGFTRFVFMIYVKKLDLIPADRLASDQRFLQERNLWDTSQVFILDDERNMKTISLT